MSQEPSYPVEAVRTAYERGRREQSVLLRAQIQSLPRYPLNGTVIHYGGDGVEFVVLADVLDLLSLLAASEGGT